MKRALRRFGEDLYERYGPAVAELVGVPITPKIQVDVEPRGPGAAWTSGDRVVLSAAWFAQHPDDVGGCLHEFAHAIMRAPVYDDETAWLIEGIADYVRDVLGFDASWTRAHHEPGEALAGYQTTAHFLMFCEARHPGTVRRLSQLLIRGEYSDASFEGLCGEPLASLVTEYEAAQDRAAEP